MAAVATVGKSPATPPWQSQAAPNLGLAVAASPIKGLVESPIPVADVEIWEPEQDWGDE